ncbi:MAG: dihydropteroate synthase [Bacteroidales bacterium]|nr:dihydropteroate synthase [Bacteroidales bacterium]
MTVQQTPQVMGIINANNESFFSSSRFTAAEEIGREISNMISLGASIIDIGACSTRPGSTPVTQEQEWDYLRVALDVVEKRYLGAVSTCGEPVKFSIDTFRSEIVRRSYDIIGKFIVNDISAGEDDPRMLPTVGELDLPYIAMHKRGTPATMQQMCDYPNGVVEEVIRYFKEFEQRASQYGITEYIMDPGFGFAKNLEQNYTLFKGMPHLVEEIMHYSGKRRKLLVGISRKGMIWRPLGITPDEALCGTVAMNLQALMLGADIIRVHDVKEGMQCVKLWECLTS